MTGAGEGVLHRWASTPMSRRLFDLICRRSGVPKSPPFELEFWEYQDLRRALAQSIGALNAVAEAKPKGLNMAEVKRCSLDCEAALALLRSAWERREIVRD